MLLQAKCKYVINIIGRNHLELDIKGVCMKQKTKTYFKGLFEYLKGKKDVTINSNDNSIPYIINFSVQNRKSNDLQKILNDSEIYVSTKTSCCPIETPSKLVYAVTKNKGLASSSIRLSLSHLTTNVEIDKFIEVMNNIIG